MGNHFSHLQPRVLCGAIRELTVAIPILINQRLSYTALRVMQRNCKLATRGY